MNEVKRIEKNGFVLVHSWSLDDMGFKRNDFKLMKGNTAYMMGHGPLRVVTTSLSEPYGGDDVSPLSDEQYEKMLGEYIERLKGKEPNV